MSMAARVVSSRATSSMSLAGMTLAIASGPAEGARDELGKPLLELGGDGGRDVAGAAGALAVDGAPLLEVGVVVDAELHGHRVDERLEPLGQWQGHRVGTVPRLDGGRDLLPGDDAVLRHQPPMNCASSATRSPGASRESRS